MVLKFRKGDRVQVSSKDHVLNGKIGTVRVTGNSTYNVAMDENPAQHVYTIDVCDLIPYLGQTEMEIKKYLHAVCSEMDARLTQLNQVLQMRHAHFHRTIWYMEFLRLRVAIAEAQDELSVK